MELTGEGVTEGRVAAEQFPETVRDDDPAFDPTIAHQARIYNYLLGGKDHYEADREYTRQVEALTPGVRATARANRAFLGRAVRFLAGEAGLSQFLDIGTGIPAPGSTHEVAQEARPDSRCVYVDFDPVVLAHARAFLVAHEPGSTDYIDADLRDPDRILERARRTLDFSRPVGLLLVAILHAIPDEDDPYGIVSRLADALPVGSYLVISHWRRNPADEEGEEKIASLTRTQSRQQYTPRSGEGIARFLGGLEVIEPGVVPVQDWRPGANKSRVPGTTVWLGGVARKQLRPGVAS